MQAINFFVFFQMLKIQLVQALEHSPVAVLVPCTTGDQCRSKPKTNSVCRVTRKTPQDCHHGISNSSDKLAKKLYHLKNAFLHSLVR
jgi:hypothetical protein